jgi:hypothetical protein
MKLEIKPDHHRAFYAVTIFDDVGAPMLTDTVPQAELFMFVVEAATVHNFDLNAWPPECGYTPGCVPHIHISLADTNQVDISIKNGDDGVLVHQLGSTLLDAVVALMRQIGFKSGIMRGERNLCQYLDDYVYGIERLSNERLALEMESITAPEKGAW